MINKWLLNENRTRMHTVILDGDTRGRENLFFWIKQKIKNDEIFHMWNWAYNRIDEMFLSATNRQEPNGDDIIHFSFEITVESCKNGLHFSQVIFRMESKRVHLVPARSNQPIFFSVCRFILQRNPHYFNWIVCVFQLRWPNRSHFNWFSSFTAREIKKKRRN